jgi:DNA-binding NarL/FixJ family response regulator
MSGPLQVIALNWGPGAVLRDRVLAEVDRLQGRGVLRLLDVLVIAKDDDGTIERVVIGDDDFGGVLASLVLGNDSASMETSASGPFAGLGSVNVRALVESLTAGDALAFLLIEHGWALPLMDAIGEAGGVLFGEGFLSSEAESRLAAELVAIDEGVRAISLAQAAEADATLLAIEAQIDAFEAVAAADALRSAAAASAVRALLSAGIIEQAAAHEAIDALTAAGLIVAEADELAAEAVIEGAARIRAASITLAQARVLRYLPTTSTFAVIAGKLGISRAAAKERAERAYKKLGVHNRADAVSRARALKLID